MRRVGCHVWCDPSPDEIALAARVRPDAPEVWTSARNPHLTLIRRLWPSSTIRTVGPDGAPDLGPLAMHTVGDPDRLDLLTLDRPRHTVVIACPSASAPSPDVPT